MLAGPSGFNGRIQGQQIGLSGDIGDGRDYLDDFLQLQLQARDDTAEMLFSGVDASDARSGAATVSFTSTYGIRHFGRQFGNILRRWQQFSFNSSGNLLTAAGDGFRRLRQLLSRARRVTGNGGHFRRLTGDGHGSLNAVFDSAVQSLFQCSQRSVVLCPGASAEIQIPCQFIN